MDRICVSVGGGQDDQRVVDFAVTKASTVDFSDRISVVLVGSDPIQKLNKSRIGLSMHCRELYGKHGEVVENVSTKEPRRTIAAPEVPALILS